MDKKRHANWVQGRFINQPQYRYWTDKQKAEAEAKERLLVRLSPLDNAICRCQTPEDAEFIANRLNFAARIINRGFNEDHFDYKEEMQRITPDEASPHGSIRG